MCGGYEGNKCMCGIFAGWEKCRSLLIVMHFDIGFNSVGWMWKCIQWKLESLNGKMISCADKAFQTQNKMPHFHYAYAETIIMRYRKFGIIKMKYEPRINNSPLSISDSHLPVS